MRRLFPLLSFVTAFGLIACDTTKPAPAEAPQSAASTSAQSAPASAAAASTMSVMPQSAASVALVAKPGRLLPQLIILPPDFGSEDDDKTGDKVVLFVEGSVYTRCGALKLPAPNFPLDSAKIKFEEADELRELGRCLTSDPFDKMGVTLVGRSDPRGTRTYNKALAKKRAETVKRVLVVHGVVPARIRIESAGEPKPGVDIRSYEDARRVDILLTQVDAKMVK